MSKEEPQVEWSLGMMRTLVYYTVGFKLRDPSRQ